jgi:hypothetical protein
MYKRRRRQARVTCDYWYIHITIISNPEMKVRSMRKKWWGESEGEDKW